jgi:hypothetical protein
MRHCSSRSRVSDTTFRRGWARVLKNGEKRRKNELLKDNFIISAIIRDS